MNEIANLISTLGFPIVACIYLARNQAKSLDKMSDVVNANTRMVERLLTKIDAEELMEEDFEDGGEL